MGGSRSGSANEALAALPVFTFNSDAQALAHFDEDHRLILLGGGVGSGKTVLHGPHAIRMSAPRSEADRKPRQVDQLHGLFTNTQIQLEKAVIPSIKERFVSMGMEEPVYDKKPPMSWVRRWVRDGIDVPSVARYRGILTAPTGYHALCGTLHNQSFHQYETIQLSTIRIEEAINCTLEAISTLIERVRCSTGGGEHCRKFHRHQRYLIFNPPRGAHPWLYAYLDQLEEAARAYYHPLLDGQECECPREHGAELTHRNWPLLQSGIGPAVLYRSKTSDNASNLDDGYGDGLAAGMSKDTARRRLDGEIIRETAGRAYVEFGDENVRPVGYDPDRSLYLGLDFNLSPRAAVFAHPLNPGEYDSRYERPGVLHLGVFGEFFHVGEMDDRRFALELVRGARGSGGDSQPSYRSEANRGLPPPCDEDCEPICRRGHWNGLKGHRGPIYGFGDQRGTHRSSHAENLGSSWEIVERVFLKLGSYGRDVPEDQPSPRSRVDAVNAKLCNAFDLRSLWIDPRCEELIRDLEQVMWDDNGQELREWRRGSMGTEWHRTHLSDGLGYMVHRLAPGGEDNTGLAGVVTALEHAPVRQRRTQYPMSNR